MRAELERCQEDNSENENKIQKKKRGCIEIEEMQRTVIYIIGITDEENKALQRNYYNPRNGLGNNGDLNLHIENIHQVPEKINLK